uniref:EGF-like domain-containing protein n=1 Tax=Echeneis naucrates TaxID=173247 RepID=A0A665WGE6_ECHNA
IVYATLRPPNIDMMTRTARDVLLFGFFLCRLGGAAPVQSGHCAGNQCLVVLLDNKNFTGAGETCSEYSGTLLTINPEDLKILSGLLSGLDAGLWLQLPGSSGLQKCSSISVSAAGELAVRWLPCSEQLDGVLCQQTYTDTCGAVEPSAAAQKDGATAPDSKHLCFEGRWTQTCTCPEGHTLHRNQLSCKENPCRAQCYCMEGYITDERNGTIYCTDINECDSDHMCQHRCENTFGSYKCLCHEGYRLHKDGMCVPIEIEEVKGEENDLRSPSGAVPHYVKTGSALGISAFIMLCAVLLCCLVRHMRRRCGKFKLSSLSHPDIDIFYLQQCNFVFA